MSNQYGAEPPQQPAQGGTPRQPNGQPPLPPQQQPGFANPYAGVPGIPQQQAVPPYASAPGPQPHATPGSYTQQGQQAPYGSQAPYGAPQPYSAPPARRGLSGGAIAGIVVGAVAVVGLIALGIFFALTVLFVPKAPPYAAPTLAPPPTVAPVPTATPVEPEATAEPTAEAGPDPELAAKTKTMLSDMRTKYANTGDAAYVWQQIPKTAKNEGAVQAFAYAIADMQVAMIWGPSASDLQEYQTKALEYERKLLAQEPLGVNMKIGRGDGTTFNYDGDTGESWVSSDG